MTTTLLMFCVVVLATALHCQAYLPFTTCEFTYEKVGCFADQKERALPQELVNDRDTTNPAYDGHMIDWKKYRESVHSLACRCAAKTREKGYEVFGLQFYGECWSGPDGESTYDRYGVANADKCFQNIYNSSDTDCHKDREQECIGGVWTNYVYQLKEVPRGVPDKWNEWSEWTLCSKTCGGGTKSRKRTCANPEPKTCSGVETQTETADCGKQDCPIPCTKALDIGVILDGSSSVGQEHFKVAIAFIKHLLKFFDISPEGTHVGFIVYSTNAKLEFKMSDNRFYSYENLVARLNEVEYPEGSTYTDKALEMASNELFTPAGGDRPDKPNVLIVLTDGNTSLNSKPYHEVLTPLKDKKVLTIAVGIGEEINDAELKTIAMGDPKHVVHVETFQNLIEELTYILNESCSGHE